MFWEYYLGKKLFVFILHNKHKVYSPLFFVLSCLGKLKLDKRHQCRRYRCVVMGLGVDLSRCDVEVTTACPDGLRAHPPPSGLAFRAFGPFAITICCISIYRSIGSFYAIHLYEGQRNTSIRYGKVSAVL